jgi:hypothetical protein
MFNQLIIFSKKINLLKKNLNTMFFDSLDFHSRFNKRLVPWFDCSHLVKTMVILF